MGEGRQYNQDDDEERTSKIKKVTITEEESNVAEADNDEPVPNTGDTPVQDREPSDDEPTTDDERYKAASG